MKVIQQDFDSYYGAIFGERWPQIKEALALPERQVRRWNRFAGGAPSIDEISWLPFSDWLQSTATIPRKDSGLLAYYVLDPASVLVAENLEVKPGEQVLDMCAAPGGKSLILAQALFQDLSVRSELVLNELSPDRRERLKKVVQNYIPRDIRDQLWVKGKDGLRLGLERPSSFDAILLDAPCSGERHLIENSKELSHWKEARTKGLAQKQYSLLCSAWLALRPGGRLMYSTCALSPLENDGVIEKFLKKKEGVEVVPVKRRAPDFEETRYGILYLPDRSGFGPMYSCLLIKSSSL